MSNLVLRFSAALSYGKRTDSDLKSPIFCSRTLAKKDQKSLRQTLPDRHQPLPYQYLRSSLSMRSTWANVVQIPPTQDKPGRGVLVPQKTSKIAITATFQATPGKLDTNLQPPLTSIATHAPPVFPDITIASQTHHPTTLTGNLTQHLNNDIRHTNRPATRRLEHRGIGAKQQPGNECDKRRALAVKRLRRT